MLDLRQSVPGDVVAEVEQALRLELDSSTAAYGSAGGAVGYVSSGGTWVRIRQRPRGRLNEQAWAGAEAASVLEGVARPELLRSVRWSDSERGVVWRAEELTLVRSRVVSSSGSVAVDPDLPEVWWGSLKASLTTLMAHRTSRVGMSQEHLPANR